MRTGNFIEFHPKTLTIKPDSVCAFQAFEVSADDGGVAAVLEHAVCGCLSRIKAVFR